MIVHVFEGQRKPVAYTKDNTGNNLPEEFGPWKHAKVTEINSGDKVAGDDPDTIIADIQQRGYHLADEMITVLTP